MFAFEPYLRILFLHSSKLTPRFLQEHTEVDASQSQEIWRTAFFSSQKTSHIAPPLLQHRVACVQREGFDLLSYSFDPLTSCGFFKMQQLIISKTRLSTLRTAKMDLNTANTFFSQSKPFIFICKTLYLCLYMYDDVSCMMISEKSNNVFPQQTNNKKCTISSLFPRY